MARNSTSTINQILTSATKLFAASGFLGVSTREIAREADVNEVTLFRHYTRKHDLYQACVTRALAQASIGWSDLERPGSSNDFSHLFSSLSRHIAAFVAEHRELIRLLQFAILEGEISVEQKIRDRIDAEVLEIRRTLESARGTPLKTTEEIRDVLHSSLALAISTQILKPLISHDRHETKMVLPSPGSGVHTKADGGYTNHSA